MSMTDRPEYTKFIELSKLPKLSSTTHLNIVYLLNVFPTEEWEKIFLELTNSYLPPAIKNGVLKYNDHIQSNQDHMDAFIDDIIKLINDASQSTNKLIFSPNSGLGKLSDLISKSMKKSTVKYTTTDIMKMFVLIYLPDFLRALKKYYSVVAFDIGKNLIAFKRENQTQDYITASEFIRILTGMQ